MEVLYRGSETFYLVWLTMFKASHILHSLNIQTQSISEHATTVMRYEPLRSFTLGVANTHNNFNTYSIRIKYKVQCAALAKQASNTIYTSNFLTSACDVIYTISCSTLVTS